MKKSITTASLKSLSVLLAIVIVIVSLPLSALALGIGDEDQQFSDTSESMKEIVELTDKRTETTKTFRLEDGTYYLAQYDTDVHYLDENGVWQDIDNTLSVSGSEISTSNAKIKLAKNTTGNGSLFTLHDGNRKLTLSLNGANKKVEGIITNNEAEFSEDTTQLQKMTTLDKISASVRYYDILQNIDLEYVIKGLNIKENIIVKAPSDECSYSFTLSLNNLVAEMNEKGEIMIADPSSEEIAYIIPAPVMWDSNGVASDRVSMTLTSLGNGKYTLTVTADSEWMNSSDRAYPVTIDPPIYTSSNSSVLDLDFSSESSAPYTTDESLYVGDQWRAYWKLTTLPALPASAYITEAQFTLTCFTATELSGYVGAYDVLTDWDNTLTWSKMTNAVSPQGKPAEYFTDFQEIYTFEDGSGYHCLNDFFGYHWNITPIVKKWYAGENYGLTLAPVTGRNFTGIARFRSNDYTNSEEIPKLCIQYRDMKGLESYWSSVSQSAGFAGSGSVTLATGNLTFAIPTMTTTDDLFPITPTLVYNSAMAKKYYVSGNAKTARTVAGYGYGFTLNLDETIVPYTVGETLFYIMTDSDGTEHYFSKAGNSDSEYRDEDGLKLTLNVRTNSYTVTDDDNNVKTFQKISGAGVNGSGFLTMITDRNCNSVILERNSVGNITAVILKPFGTSSEITQLTLSYNTAGMLSEVRNPASNEAIRFYYSSNGENATGLSRSGSGYLGKIEYVYGTGGTVGFSARYLYTSSGYLTNVINSDTNTMLLYSYSLKGRVIDVSEYGNGLLGQEILFEYRTGSTVIHSSGCDDLLYDLPESEEDEGEESADNILTTYVFDNYGRTVSCYSTDLTGTVLYGASSGTYVGEENENAKNSLKTSTVTTLSSPNYLLNGNFEAVSTNGSNQEVLQHWTESGEVYVMGSTPGLAYRQALLMTQSVSRSLISQEVTLPAGNYYLSVDVFPYENTNQTAYIKIESLTSNRTVVQKPIPINEANASAGSMNVGVGFEAGSGEKFRISFCLERISGTTPGSNSALYLDHAMLAKATGTAVYDMMQDGHFESVHQNSILGEWKNSENQSMDNAEANDGICSIVADSPLRGNVLKMDVPMSEYGFIDQVIYQYSDSDDTDVYDLEPRLFTVSGWGKGTGQGYSSLSQFGIYAEIRYRESSGEYSSETFYFDFCKDSTEWQFISGGFATNPDKGYIDRITVSLVYHGNPGVGYFDDISVTMDSTSTAIYDYNSAGYQTSYRNGKNSMFCLYGDTDFPARPTEVLYSNGKYVEYEYDTSGNVNSERHGNYVNGEKAPKTLSFSLYSRGLLTFEQVIDLETPDQQYVTEYDYYTESGSHIFGKLKSCTDTMLQTTYYFYNHATGQPTGVIGPDGRGLAYLYDEMGNLSEVVPAIGSGEGYSRITTGAKVEYTYNSVTKRLESISTESSTYHFTYDNYGNSASIGVGNRTLAEYLYNAQNGKLNTLTYGNGFEVKYVYDPLDRIAEIQYNTGSGGSFETVYEYTYDSYNRLSKIIDYISEETIYYTYDATGKLVGAVTADSSATVEVNRFSKYFYYDEESRITDAFYGFDYHTSARAVSELLNCRYRYQDNGMLETYTFENRSGLSGTFTPTYDNLLRTQSRNVTFTKNGTSIFYQNVTYSYTTTDDEEYDDTLQSGRVSEYTSAIGKSEGTAFSTTYHYEYDANGNITQIKNGSGVVQNRYTYDGLGQLIREDNRALGKTYVWTYDNAGNILTKKTYAFTTSNTLGTLQSTQTYTYGDANWGDLLTGFGGKTITYDSIGNPTWIGEADNPDGDDSYISFVWENGRQLKEYFYYGTSGEGNFTVDYTYNADGIRTSKTYVNDYDEISLRREYILSGSTIIGETLYEYNWDYSGDYEDDEEWYLLGNIVYLYDEAGSPIGMAYREVTNAEGVYEYFFFEKNLQGDIIAVYNAIGTKLVTYKYDAWGAVTTTYQNGGVSTNVVYNPFRYRGYYYDTETGFYYLQSRYYNPNWGRFINVDAYVSTGTGLLGYNMFVYCGNNPVMGYDPTGERDWGKFWDAVVTAVAVVAGVIAGVNVATVLIQNKVPDSVAVSAGVMTATTTIGLINNTVNAVYYHFSDGESDLEQDPNKSSYVEEGYIDRWRRLDYVKSQLGGEYTLNAWRYYSEYSFHMYAWMATGWAYEKEIPVFSKIASSAYKADIRFDQWDNRFSVNIFTVAIGILGL